MSEKRMIRLYVNTGFIGANHQKFAQLPDGWDDMNEDERDEYLDLEAQEFLSSKISYGGEVVEADAVPRTHRKA